MTYTPRDIQGFFRSFLYSGAMAAVSLAKLMSVTSKKTVRAEQLYLTYRSAEIGSFLYTGAMAAVSLAKLMSVTSKETVRAELLYLTYRSAETSSLPD